MKKSHTTLDDNDKVETKKKYLLRYQSQQHEKSSRVEIEKKKGTGLKKLSCRSNQETLFYIHCQSLLD